MSESPVGATSVGCKAFESYKVLRSYAEHEGTLLNNRVTWLLVSNAFLFASVGFTVREMASSESEILTLFVQCSAVAGFLFSVVSFPSILASHRASNALKTAWSNYSKELAETKARANEYFVVPIAGAGNEWAAKGGSWAALVLPGLLALLWVIVFGYVYANSGAEQACDTYMAIADYHKCAISKLQKIIEMLEEISNSEHSIVK